MPVNSRAAAGLSVLSLLLLAACGQAAQLGAAGGDMRPSAPPEPPPATSGLTPGPLAALDPCTLLSPAERSTVGLASTGEPKNIGTARTCDWTVPGRFGVAISVHESMGLKQLKVSRKTAKAAKVAGREALKVADEKADDGTCALLLGAGDSASVQVDVSNTSFSGTKAACERAAEVAGFVEAKLP